MRSAHRSHRTDRADFAERSPSRPQNALHTGDIDMKTGLLPLLAGAAILALAGTASAGDRTPSAPLRLSDAQMDGVTAGATSIGVGLGAAAGTLFSGTAIQKIGRA